MITISIRDYTIEQLKDLAFGLTVVADNIHKRYGCEYDVFCERSCEGYAICTDLFNAWRYLHKKIREREIDEKYRAMQERGFEYINN